MESNLFSPRVTKALQAADRIDAREYGGTVPSSAAEAATCPSDCLVSGTTQVKHLALTLLLSPFPCWTAFDQQAILEPYSWMAEIKRRGPGNELSSVYKGQTTSDSLSPQKNTVPKEHLPGRLGVSASLAVGSFPHSHHHTHSLRASLALGDTVLPCPGFLAKKHLPAAERKVVPCCVPVKHDALGISGRSWLFYHSLKYAC